MTKRVFDIENGLMTYEQCATEGNIVKCEHFLCERYPAQKNKIRIYGNDEGPLETQRNAHTSVDDCSSPYLFRKQAQGYQEKQRGLFSDYEKTGQNHYLLVGSNSGLEQTFCDVTELARHFIRNNISRVLTLGSVLIKPNKEKAIFAGLGKTFRDYYINLPIDEYVAEAIISSIRAQMPDLRNSSICELSYEQKQIRSA